METIELHGRRYGYFADALIDQKQFSNKGDVASEGSGGSNARKGTERRGGGKRSTKYNPSILGERTLIPSAIIIFTLSLPSEEEDSFYKGGFGIPQPEH